MSRDDESECLRFAAQGQQRFHIGLEIEEIQGLGWRAPLFRQGDARRHASEVRFLPQAIG